MFSGTNKCTLCSNNTTPSQLSLTTKLIEQNRQENSETVQEEMKVLSVANQHIMRTHSNLKILYLRICNRILSNRSGQIYCMFKEYIIRDNLDEELYTALQLTIFQCIKGTTYIGHLNSFHLRTLCLVSSVYNPSVLFVYFSSSIPSSPIHIIPHNAFVYSCDQCFYSASILALAEGYCCCSNWCWSLKHSPGRGYQMRMISYLCTILPTSEQHPEAMK